jgi:regulator of PEP synthase PpsR (kinase-PPPase family)
LRAKNDDLEDKIKLIQSLQKQMEDLCMQFSVMLSDIMMHMKEKIEEQSELYSRQSPPIQYKLEEITFD